VPNSGHVTITKIENLHLDTRRKIVVVRPASIRSSNAMVGHLSPCLEGT